ncbi:MAG: GYF domain-containing protein, partial [Pseudomonadota bacterium]
MFSAENWCVKVNDKVYGPYTSQQLRKFAHEGRLAAWSLIAPAGSRAWRKAQDENTFSSFFGVETTREASGSKSFGKR